MMPHAYNLSTYEPKQENGELKASLGYLARFCPNYNNSNNSIHRTRRTTHCKDNTSKHWTYLIGFWMAVLVSVIFSF